MGYADGYYYGQGRIICDTSTFSVGDTIRVRSMTDSSKVWNQQVATVGTALVFTVPCYDYYKICTVQTINDTLTEIGGVYKTVDYGQTLFINVLNKSSLAGIQAILNAHQETQILNIGDEVTIEVSNAPWVMQIADINRYSSHEVIFVSKLAWQTNRWAGNASGYYADNDLRTKVQSFYSYIAETDRQYISARTKSGHISAYQNAGYKDFSDKIWIPNAKEVLGDYPDTGYRGSPNIAPLQFSLFTTQENRVRLNSSDLPVTWWTCDGSAQAPTYYYAWGISATGTSSFNTNTTTNYIVPCFILTEAS